MLWVIIAWIGVLVANPALAQEETPEESEPKPRWTGSWQPPDLNSRGWDWVRLTSDEWVKGEIVVMRDFELKFDSDEFDLVEFDWEDVAEIVTEHEYIVVLQNFRTSYAGTLTMHDDRVLVKVGEGVEIFDRDEVLAITPSAVSEWNLWSGDISAALSLRSGNTDEAELNGRARLDRNGRQTRLGLEYNGIYGSANNQKNANSHRGRTLLDYFLTRDLFVTPFAFEAFTDEFQNISYRLTGTAGAGYYLIRSSPLEWDVRLGAGYQYVRSDSAVLGDDKTSSNGALLFGTLLDTDLTSRVDLVLEYRLQFIVPETERTNHHGEARFEFDLTSAIDLDVSFIWDRIENPQEGSDGDQPESDDFRLTVGLGIEF